MTPAASAPVLAGTADRGAVARWADLVRVRQWLKNGFVLAGLFFSDQLLELDLAVRAVVATVAFCFASSAVYCLNDIVDREADAAHPEKRDRPIASGEVSVREATVLIAVAVLACVVTLALARFRWQVPVAIAAYLVANVAYSAKLKHVALVDVVVIASGFVLRLVAGTWAVGVAPTSWIVLSTGLLAIFLALGKRRGDVERELITARQSLTGYSLAFIDQALAMMGAATLVFYAAFTVSDYAQDRFETTVLYLTAFPVAVGLLRYLQLVMVMGRYGSPTDIVVSDRPLQVVAAVWLALFGVIVYT